MTTTSTRRNGAEGYPKLMRMPQSCHWSIGVEQCGVYLRKCKWYGFGEIKINDRDYTGH